MATSLEDMLSRLAKPGHGPGFIRLIREGCSFRSVEFRGVNVFDVVQDLLVLRLIEKIGDEYGVTLAGFERIRQSEYLNRKV